ncbi:MAG: nuclear transport factor 2 family protein [Burkholderiaceae bacterium]
MSEQTIRTLYESLARLDGDAVAACYAEQASFDDEAFSLKGRREVGGMWRMLCETTRNKGRADWKVEFSQVHAHDGHGSAHWDAYYRFSTTGRLVHNSIDAEMTFDAAGLILTQRDRFSFWRWSRQALGTPGLLLGWSPMLRNKVRKMAAGNLQRYLAGQPA